jgi:nitrilase
LVVLAYCCETSTLSLLHFIMDKIVKVGAVQAEPVWLDLEGSVDKTIALIEQAASDGVQVLGFPEVWIPGYPW